MNATTWKQRFDDLREKSGLPRYQFQETPEAMQLYREAWKAVPKPQQAEINQVLADTKFRSPIFCRRWDHAKAYLDGGDAALQESLDELREGIRLRQESRQLIDENRRRKAAEESARLANWNTPEAIEQRQKERDRRTQAKINRVARQVAAALAEGIEVSPKGKCVFCQRPLTDAVSRYRGVGSECWHRILPAIRKLEREQGTTLDCVERISRAMGGSK